MSTRISKAHTGFRGSDRSLIAAMCGFLALFVLSVVVPSIAGGGTMPAPGAPATDLQQWAGHRTAVIAAGALMMAAAGAVAVFGDLLGHRLAAAGPAGRGPVVVRSAAIAAAVALAACGVVVMLLGNRGTTASADSVATLGRAAFALGGPVHTLLLGGVTLGWALTLTRLGGSRPAIVAMGILSALCALSAGAVFSDALVPLVPIGRFPTMLGLLLGTVRWLPRPET
ncbi:hypothetical protein [Nocardia sp. N2S4-5]|uniref:hypothetical protein n=1 Tax=Nocardia sp. N2S4-5 TaxID=3351565 RepID=UPI0037CEADF4